MATRWAWPVKSVGFARQTALATENVTDGEFSWAPVQCELPESVAELFDLAIATGQVGTFYPPVTGDQTGTIKVKWLNYGAKRSYDPETEELGITASAIPVTIPLTALCLGSSSDSITTAANFLSGLGLSGTNFTATKSATYGNGDVASAASASQFNVGTGNGADYKAGQFYVGGPSKTSTALSRGWIKTIATDTITLADAAENTPIAGDDTFSTVVAHSSGQQPQPVTIRIVGKDAEFKIALVGCLPTKLSIEGVAGKPVMLEAEFSWLKMTVYATGGGFASTAHTVTPTQPYPLSKTGGGRATLNINGGTYFATTGLQDFKVDIENQYGDIQGHGGLGGIGERSFEQRITNVSLKFPRSSGDAVSNGMNQWRKALVDGTSFGIALYCGILPGTNFSIFLPALYLSEETKMALIGNTLSDELKFRPGVYTGDTGTTAPADSPVRLGWG
jgi:hypothetical protein